MAVGFRYVTFGRSGAFCRTTPILWEDATPSPALLASVSAQSRDPKAPVRTRGDGKPPLTDIEPFPPSRPDASHGVHVAPAAEKQMAKAPDKSREAVERLLHPVASERNEAFAEVLVSPVRAEAARCDGAGAVPEVGPLEWRLREWSQDRQTHFCQVAGEVRPVLIAADVTRRKSRI